MYWLQKVDEGQLKVKLPPGGVICLLLISRIIIVERGGVNTLEQARTWEYTVLSKYQGYSVAFYAAKNQSF